MLNRSRLMWVAGAFVALTAGIAACGSTSSGNTSTGVTGCTPGATTACACLGGTMGVQSCKDDGKSFGTCQCVGASSSSGVGGATAAASSSSGVVGTCGDGKIEDSDHCNDPASEFYCKSDCSLGTGGSDAGMGGAGGACAGHVYYAGKFDGASSIWAGLPAAGGQTGLDAGNSQCKGLGIGADHVCDYEEVKAAAAAHEASFMAIPMGTTAWVQRTTTVNLVGTAPVATGGTPSMPGSGGRCNNWTYGTNHISDGEYVTFDAAGTPTFHLDGDTFFDATCNSTPGCSSTHTIPGDLQCGGATRSILCCQPVCN